MCPVVLDMRSQCERYNQHGHLRTHAEGNDPQVGRHVALHRCDTAATLVAIPRVALGRPRHAHMQGGVIVTAKVCNLLGPQHGGLPLMKKVQGELGVAIL